MKNNVLCFAHFKRVCEDKDCPVGDPETARVSFGDIAEGGIPCCRECGKEMKFVGVEIVPQKPSKKKFLLKLRYGNNALDDDRPVCKYEFSTPEDRDKALAVLNNYDGYKSYKVLYPKN